MDATRTTVPIETLLAERDWVRWLARTLVADPNGADDLEAQTWLAAVERPPASAVSVRGWLATVLRRAASKGRRSATRSERRERTAARPEGERSTVDIVAEAEQHDRVVRAVLDLEEPYRTTVLLRFFESLPPRDIAERMNVPVETARSRVQRGVALLRERFDRDHQGDRKAWMAAFLPLTTPRPSDAGPVAPSVPVAGGWKAVAVGCAAVVAVGGAVLWWTRSTGESQLSPTTIATRIDSATGPASDSVLAASGRTDGANAPTTGLSVFAERAPVPAGNLTGRVLRDGSGVAGARVVALRRSTRREEPDAFETTSEGDGHYHFAELPTGEVMVFADAPGLTTQGLADASFEGFNSLATSITATETAVLDIELVPGAIAAGRVLDPEGKPLARATVSATRSERTGRPRFFDHVRALPPWTTTTAEDGAFQFDVLPQERTYDFEVLADGFVPGHREAIVVPGDDARGIVIRLPASRWIDVQVLDDESSEPLAGVEVRVGSLNGERLHTRARGADLWITSPDGSAHVGPTIEADVSVRASLPRPFGSPVVEASSRVAGGETSIVLRLDRSPVPTEIDQMRALAVTKDQRVRVFGPDGTPVPTARAIMYKWGPKGGGGLTTGTVSGGLASCGYSEPPADYVDIYDVRDADGVPLSLGAAHVALAKDRREVSVRLEPERTISGRVVGPDGAPLSGVRVQAQPDWVPAEAWTLAGYFHATARTDASGSFRFAGLGNTAYRLSLRLPKHLTSDAVTIVAAGASEVVLTTRGSVRPVLTILDSNGKPVPSASVGLLPPGSDPRDRDRIADRAEIPDVVQTDDRGVAVLGPLDPGALFLLTVNPPKSRPELNAEIVDGWLGHDETRTLGIERLLRGRVRDPSGAVMVGIEGLEVVCTTNTRGGGRSAVVGSDGTFLLKGVAPGEVMLIPHYRESPTSMRSPQSKAFAAGADDVDVTFDPGLLLIVRIEGSPSQRPHAQLVPEGVASKDERAVRAMAERSAGADTTYRFRGLRPDRMFTLCVSPVDGLSLIREGVRSDAGELTVRLEPGLELRGRVLLPDGATDVQVGFNDGRISANAEVDADGRFVFTGLPAGSYPVNAWIRVGEARRSASATIRAGESGDIDLRKP